MLKPVRTGSPSQGPWDPDSLRPALSLGGQASDGKACNVGDLDLIPGLGRSLGEGNGYQFQHYCLDLVKAMVFPVVMYGCESWTVKKAEC